MKKKTLVLLYTRIYENIEQYTNRITEHCGPEGRGFDSHHSPHKKSLQIKRNPQAMFF